MSLEGHEKSFQWNTFKCQVNNYLLDISYNILFSNDNPYLIDNSHSDSNMGLVLTSGFDYCLQPRA